MTKKFIAIAPKGTEFIFNKATMIAVPENSAKKIVNVLNDMRYKLKDGEVWHIYDNDFYYNTFINSEIKRFSNRMKVYAYNG